MQSPKQVKNTDTKTQHKQENASAKKATSDAQSINILQRDPLVRHISQMGNTPNPSTHAAILNRTPAHQKSSNTRLLLQLQQQYGNPYVNQVLQLAREMGGKTSTNPTQTKPEIATLQRQELPEEEKDEQPVQTKPEISTLQRQEMPPKEDEEENKTAQMKPEISTLQRQELPEETTATPSQQPPIQAKLTINPAGDKYEQEADRVADQVVQRMNAPVVERSPESGAIQREDMPEQVQKKPEISTLQRQEIHQKRRVQMKSANQHQSAEANMASTQDLEGSIQQAQGSGQPISDKVRQPLEQEFGADFSGVKIHTNAQSDQLNKSIQARAFTTGQNVFFRQGAYDPGSQSGQKLLAHELTHVVQQNGSAVPAKSVSKKENKVQAKPLVTPSSSQPQPIVQCKEQNSPETTNPDNKQSPKEQEQTKPDNKQGQPTQPIPPAGDTAQGQGQPQAPAGGGAASASQGESANEAGATTVPVMAEAIASPITGEQKAPASPQEDPAFQAVTSNAETVAKEQQQHQPAGEKAEEAQAAAEPPTNEVESKAQANQVGEMEQAETPEFDAAGFKAKLMQKINDVAPKNLEEADEFKNDNKLDSVKEDLGDTVKEEQKASQEALGEKTQETPDTSGIEPKAVEPLPPTEPGEAPTDINAHKAAPKSKGESEVEAPLQEDSKKLDKQMADADVTEEQLAKSNEPEFQATLQSKGEAQTNAQEAPPKYREDEQGLISKAEGAAVATAQEQMQGMHDTRVQQFGEVADKQAGTKGKDEEARTKVATDINKIYEDTKAKVEKTLSDLDTQVGQEFDAGSADAKKAFEDYVDQRMKKYKEERYGGAFGWLRWIGDKLFGMPDEVNAFYQEGRDIYIQKMDVVIDKVVTIISQGLTKAKAEIANGKQEIQNYLNQLPEDLQEVGQEAAAEIESKFEDLQQTVSDKEDELVDSLSQKYKENLKEIDDRINEMKEENKGLVQKAIAFIIDTVKTIIEFGKLLLQVLARVAKVIPQILKDPIGFFKNLVQAIKQGFENFVKNIAQHLKEGLISWLTGTLAGTGIEMPKTFDLSGIFSLVTQILGLTPETIEARATERLAGGTGERSQPADATKQGKQGKGGRQGGQAGQTPQTPQTTQTPQAGQGRDSTQNTAQNSPMSSQTTADNGNQENSALAETGFDIFKILSTQGVAGLWELVKDKIGDLKAMVLDPIQTYVIESIIKAGIEWILSLMNPASAFIKACKAIYEIVKFFVERAKQIADLINAILDSIEAIAKGAIDQAVKMVEDALAKAVPVVIGFLASLLGLGGIAEKVQAIIQKLQRPIEKAINGVIDQGVKAANKVDNKVKESKTGKKVGDAVDSAKQKGEAAQQGVNDKQEATQNKFDQKKGATKDKFGKDKQKGKDSKPDEKTKTDKGKDTKPDQRTRADKGKDNKEKDEKRHKLLAQQAVSELEKTDGAKDYKTLRAEKQAQAKQIEKSYTAKLEKGIKLTVHFEDAAKDEKDGNLDFKVVIAPNMTEASGKASSSNKRNSDGIELELIENAKFEGGSVTKAKAESSSKIGYVANVPATLSNSELHELANKYIEGFGDMETARSQFALVIGLNAYQNANNEKAIREVINSFKNKWGKTMFRVGVFGFIWRNKQAETAAKNNKASTSKSQERGNTESQPAINQRTIPYGQIRDKILRHEYTKKFIAELNEAGCQDVYIHTGDADVKSFKTKENSPLFKAASQNLQKNRVDILSGGYDLRDDPKILARYASELDLAVRDAMAKANSGAGARSVYFPEPNTFFKVNKNYDNLSDEGVSFGKGSQEGKQIIESLNEKRSDAKMNFDSGLSIATSGDRIAQNIGATEGKQAGKQAAQKVEVSEDTIKKLFELAQSHANPITWMDQVEPLVKSSNGGIGKQELLNIREITFEGIAGKSGAITGTPRGIKALQPNFDAKKLTNETKLTLKQYQDMGGKTVAQIAKDTRTALITKLQEIITKLENNNSTASSSSSASNSRKSN
jgi:CHASE3 domain sensor protein